MWQALSLFFQLDKLRSQIYYKPHVLHISELVPLPVILDIFLSTVDQRVEPGGRWSKKQKVMQVTKGNFFFLWLGSLGQNGRKRAKRGAKLDKGCNQGRSSHSRTKLCAFYFLLWRLPSFKLINLNLSILVYFHRLQVQQCKPKMTLTIHSLPTSR